MTTTEAEFELCEFSSGPWTSFDSQLSGPGPDPTGPGPGAPVLVLAPVPVPIPVLVPKDLPMSRNL